MLRLMRDCHRSLGVATGGPRWTPSPLRPMLIEEPREDPSAPPSVWQLMELTNAEQLRNEGSALRHCVASYADRCWRGPSQIWSLRVRRGEKVRRVLTIEVDLRKRAVVQARGWRNRAPSGKPLRLLQGGPFARDCGSPGKQDLRCPLLRLDVNPGLVIRHVAKGVHAASCAADRRAARRLGNVRVPATALLPGLTRFRRA